MYFENVLEKVIKRSRKRYQNIISFGHVHDTSCWYFPSCYTKIVHKSVFFYLLLKYTNLNMTEIATFKED